MDPACLVISHLERDEFADPAGGIGQRAEDRPIANARRRPRVGSVDKARVVVRESPTVFPSRGTAGASTKSLWAGLAPVYP